MALALAPTTQMASNRHLRRRRREQEETEEEEEEEGNEDHSMGRLSLRDALRSVANVAFGLVALVATQSYDALEFVNRTEEFIDPDRVTFPTEYLAWINLTELCRGLKQLMPRYYCYVDLPGANARHGTTVSGVVTLLVVLKARVDAELSRCEREEEFFRLPRPGIPKPESFSLDSVAHDKDVRVCLNEYWMTDKIYCFETVISVSQKLPPTFVLTRKRVGLPINPAATVSPYKSLPYKSFPFIPLPPQKRMRERYSDDTGGSSDSTSAGSADDGHGKRPRGVKKKRQPRWGCGTLMAIILCAVVGFAILLLVLLLFFLPLPPLLRRPPT